MQNRDYQKPNIDTVAVYIEYGFSISGDVENVDKDEEVEF